MWRMKACPRCGGDLLMDTKMRQTDWECLQCGHRVETEGPDVPMVESRHWERMTTVKGEHRSIF